jgi:hypothetical protein
MGVEVEVVEVEGRVTEGRAIAMPHQLIGDFSVELELPTPAKSSPDNGQGIRLWGRVNH